MDFKEKNTQNYILDMRKGIFILFVFSLFGLSCLAQNKQYIPKLQTESTESLQYFILNGDTIRLTAPTNGQTITRINGVWTNSTSASSLYDSLTFNIETGDILSWKNGSPFDTLNIDGRYVKYIGDVLLVADSTAKYVTPYQLNEQYKELNNMIESAYKIILPSSTTVAGRIAVAVEGVNFPTGWTLAEGYNSIDLKITHNLGKRPVVVTVFSVDGTSQRQLFGNAAFSGILSENDNIMYVESLATINKTIVIYIIFV